MGFTVIAKKLVPLRVSNKYSAIKSKFHLRFPERFKGTVVEKWATFWKNMMIDYGEVAKDTAKDIRERPRRALVYSWGLAVWWYCVQTNPDGQSFRDQLISSSLELSSIPSSVRSKDSSNHAVFLESCYNNGTIRRLNLGVLSLMWIADYDKSLGLYPAQCKYLEPQILTFHHRIVDIGFLGRWWIINRKMVDSDVNLDEWNTSSAI